MSRRKANFPGWASIDLNHRQQKDGSAFVEACNQLKEEAKPSFPPISHTTTVQKKKNHFTSPMRSFSSVLLPPAAMEFPALPDKNNKIRHTQRPLVATGTSRSTTQIDASQACTKIKEVYGWEDESVIADVLAAVDNDINEASALIEEMVSYDCTEQKKDESIQVSKSNTFLLQHKCSDVSKGTSFEESVDIEESNCLQEDRINSVTRESSYEYLSYRDENSNKAAAVKNLGLEHWKNVPVEPEWEEDDIYFIHRKEALHMMRSASQHSRKASDAYMRGDHFSAQQLSARAREEWTVAERLNAKAAKEILSIRNNKHGLWKLDLHGLHTLEAVQALQERLQKLECLVRSNLSLSPNGRNSNTIAGSGIVCYSSFESLTFTKTGGTVNLDGKHRELSSLQQQRPTSLQVITGVGNHSRGEAALPTAVRNFLNDNGYRYDEARPGLITVRPKFRHK